jgi:hypothetical protein
VKVAAELGLDAPVEAERVRRKERAKKAREAT